MRLVSVKTKHWHVLCAATLALDTKGYILHMTQRRGDFQVKGFIALKN